MVEVVVGVVVEVEVVVGVVVGVEVEVEVVVVYFYEGTILSKRKLLDNFNQRYTLNLRAQ